MSLTIRYTGPPSDQPRREDHPTYEAYIEAWSMWRAVRRDNELTDEEREAKFAVVEAEARRRLGLPLDEEPAP